MGSCCKQVLEVARVLCEIAVLADLQPQVSALQHVQKELIEVARNEGAAVGDGLGIGASHATKSERSTRTEDRSGSPDGRHTSKASPSPSSPKGSHVSAGDLARGVRELAAARDEFRYDIDHSKKAIERVTEDCKVLWHTLERLSDEEVLARAEAHNALTASGELRAASEGQDMRLRLVTAEVQQLRENMVDTFRRTSENIESYSSRNAAATEDLRQLISDLASEARMLRQSVSNLEKADRQRQDDSSSEDAVSIAVERVERKIMKQVGEIRTSLQQTEAWKHDLVHKQADTKAAIQTLQERLQTTQGSPKVQSLAATDQQSERLIEFQDMPHSWRLALEDTVRSVQQISDETRQQLPQRFETLQARLEDRFATTVAQHARHLEEAIETHGAALHKSDEALAVARSSNELAHRSAEASTSTVATVNSLEGNLRQEFKATIRDAFAPLEEAVRHHEMRLTTLSQTSNEMDKNLSSLNEGRAQAFERKFADVAQQIEACALCIEEQRERSKYFLNKQFQEEVAQQFRSISEESTEAQVAMQGKMSEELAAERNASATRFDELQRTIASLAARDEEILRVLAGNDKTLKQALEEARCAMDAQGSKLQKMDEKTKISLNSLWTEVRKHHRGTTELHEKVALVMTLLQPELDFIKPCSMATGSARDAAKQLRAQTPR